MPLTACSMFACVPKDTHSRFWPITTGRLFRADRR